MELDPSIYFEPSSPEPVEPIRPAPVVPLAHVTLPTLPRPSLSPASTRVSFTQQQKSGRTSAGLDLSASMQQNDVGAMTQTGGGDHSLEDEVARARSERAARRNLTSFAAGSSSSDPRDSASARDNILNLVSAGQASNRDASTPPSLAMFMGGGQSRRVHKVNQEMTEQERQVTEQLEQEMAATRSKWTSPNENVAPAGMSLAALMNRQVGTNRSPIADREEERNEPKRWQPSGVSPPAHHERQEEPVRSHTAPAATSAAVPRSLASAFGSTASGPRLNSSSQPKIEDGDRPEHARSGGAFAMPGLTRQPASNPESPQPLVEEPTALSQSFSSDPPASPVKVAVPTSNAAATANESPSKSVPNSTLGRLRGSSIVAERLRSAEQRQQQGTSSPLSSPTKDRGSQPPASPEKRRSVLERWGRDQPNVVFGGNGSGGPTSPTKSASLPPPQALKSPGSASTAWSSLGQPMFSASPKEEEDDLVRLIRVFPTAKKGGYSKPSWDHAPIRASQTSSNSTGLPFDDAPIERKHTRGVALPGLGGNSSSPAQGSDQAPASPTKASSLPKSPSGGVRAAAMKWGRADSNAQRDKLEELKRLKESYGVKVPASRGFDDDSKPVEPIPPTRRSEPEPMKPPVRSKPVEVKPVQQRPVTPASSQSTAPVQKSTSSSDPLVDRIVALALEQERSPSLPGQVLSLDVFHLNSPTDHPHPIEHNHILHTTEILGIVARTEPTNAGQDVETFVWVWTGQDAQETSTTQERVAKLEKKTGSNVIQVKHREEPKALVEAFEGQLTICKGLREHFDHLAKRLFVVSSQAGAVFVEETNLTAKSLCSGYSAVLSLPGEVFAWLGQGSTLIEREACCQFAESIADGRSLSVLAEGEETQWWWQSLDQQDNVEYSSANYWHRRDEAAPVPALIQISKESVTRTSTLDPTAASTSIYVLDGGPLEHFVIVLQDSLQDKSKIKSALEAAKTLSSKWQQRGFDSKTPVHVLVFPTLVPRDLAFLTRSFDFEALNQGVQPKKMNVLTVEEAEKELL
ncbi:uncharacterized protein JCM15063_001624 [Sporobolomyces koalae]|uniref:uncharacterized protein n=1 Tax=Sporobolomyces koalae TaxID=500713 RepID=UPI00318138A2